VKHITHVALFCRDLDRSVAWYRDILGMKIMASNPGHFFGMSFGHKHHDLALVQAPPNFADPKKPSVGLYHFAVDTGSFEETLSVFDRVREQGVEVEKSIDHRLGIGVYLKDPDGNLVELWSEAFPSMEEAVASIAKMDPPFNENPIGYPIEIHKIWEESRGVSGSGHEK